MLAPRQQKPNTRRRGADETQCLSAGRRQYSRRRSVVEQEFAELFSGECGGKRIDII